MSRWQLSASTVTMQPFSASIANSLGTAVISLDLASVAIWASTRRCSQPQALTMCSGDLALALSKERRTLAVNGDHALAGRREAGHELLKAGPELIRIELPEHPAKRVVARQPMLQFQ